jgi:hypothetical protein
MATLWFSLVVGLDILVVAAAQWRYLDALGVAMLSGVLFQTIAASLSYLAPMLLRSNARARAKLSRRIDAGAAVRTLTWNLGVGSAALSAAIRWRAGQAGSVAALAGWGLLVVSTLWLAAAIILPPLTRSASDS